MNKRIKKIIDEIKEDNALIVLFSGLAPKKSMDQHYPFQVNRNFYYLTNLDLENINLLIEKNRDKITSTIFVEEKDTLTEAFTGKSPDKEKIKQITNVDFVKGLAAFTSYAHRLLQSSSVIYIDTYKFDSLDNDNSGIKYAKQVKENYPHLEIKNIFPFLEAHRFIKDDNEISNIKKAIEATKYGLEKVLTHLKPNINERMLEAHFNFAINEKEIDRTAFNTIVASGGNAVTLHYEYNNSTCKDGDLVLLDLGCDYQWYCSDISRTYPVNGKFSKRQKQLYDIVLNCNIKTIEFIKPGMTFMEVDNFSRNLLAKDLKAIGMIKEEQEITKYYMHSIGHPLGLDTHDVGRRKDIKVGMVMTVEPGLYIPEENIGIRIEDDIHITDKGNINLSASIIKTTEEIEAFMQKNK